MFPRVHHVYLLLYMVSHMSLQVYTTTDALRKKKKGALFFLRGTDLETAAVNGRKTMKCFLSSTEVALPGSRYMTCESWEGGREGGVCICGSRVENVQQVFELVFWGGFQSHRTCGHMFIILYLSVLYLCECVSLFLNVEVKMDKPSANLSQILAPCL